MYTSNELKLLSDQFMTSVITSTGLYHNIGLMIKVNNYNCTQLYQYLKDLDSGVMCSVVLRGILEKNAKKDELPGEAIYFVIFDHYNYLNLEFFKRHLIKLLTRAPLDDMPLILDIPVVGKIAKWRLEIGK